MQRPLWAVLLACAALNAWFAVFYFMSSPPVVDGFTIGWRNLLAVAVFIAAPATTFIPIGRMMRARFFGVEAVTGWAVLLFALTFVSPGSNLSLAEFLAVTTPLTVAIATLLTPIAFLFVRSRVTRRSRAACALIARRQGYLAALGLLSMSLLASIGVLSVYNAALIIVILGLTEFLLLARAGIVRAGRA